MLVHLLITWVPLLLRSGGPLLRHAILGTVMFNLAALIGSLLFSQLIDRKLGRPIVVLITAYFVGAGAVFSIGFAGTTFWAITVTIFLSWLLRDRRAAFAQRPHHQLLSDRHSRCGDRLVTGC
jgi:MFS transporter, AAHS family, 4-hydroxybenzoate transporter